MSMKLRQDKFTEALAAVIDDDMPFDPAKLFVVPYTDGPDEAKPQVTGDFTTPLATVIARTAIGTWNGPYIDPLGKAYVVSETMTLSVLSGGGTVMIKGLLLQVAATASAVVGYEMVEPAPVLTELVSALNVVFKLTLGDDGMKMTIQQV